MNSFRRQLTIYRKAEGTVTDGFYSEGSPSEETIMASVQALKPEDVQQLPEGRRNSKLFFIFTDTRLNLVTSANPDIVVVDSENYEVDKEEVWQNGVINHYKYLIVKVNT